MSSNGGFNSRSSQDAPNYEGQFMGVVLSNDDPEQRQRVKCGVPGLMQGDASDVANYTKDLPWIQPIVQSSFGMTTSFNVMNVPEIGSVVELEFQNGQLEYGLVRGFLPVKNMVYHPELLVNYPKRRGFLDPAQNLFYIDSTDGQEKIHFRTKANTYITVDEEGNIEVFAVKDITLTVGGSISIEVQGDANINVVGNMTSKAASWIHEGPVQFKNTVQVDLTLTADVDVIGGGKSLKDHTHGGISSGSAHTTPPD